jgi:signal transduction histidine kinase
MFQFILGALAGGLAAWWWRSDLQNYVDKKLPDVREKAADRLTVLEQRAQEALGRARKQIDRMRPAGEQRTRDVSSSRSTGV